MRITFKLDSYTFLKLRIKLRIERLLKINYSFYSKKSPIFHLWKPF
jgi:hypothetical protein